MADVEYNYEALRTIYNDMNETAATIQIKANDMMASVDRLTGMWTGPAHDAFYKEFLLHKEVMDDFVEICGLINQCLDNSLVSYNQAEDAINDAVSAISG